MHTGNYTTTEELKQILATPTLLLNLDDQSLLPEVLKLATPDFLSFRINPGMSGATQKSLIFAGPEAKYGLPFEAAISAYGAAQKAGVKRFGIHMMTGSNVLNEAYFPEAVAKLLEIAGQVHAATGIEFEYINIGGGFGVPYRPNEVSLNLDRIARSIRLEFDKALARFHFREPKLMVEPGRMIMADAGFLVTRVNVIKAGYKKFVGVDAGMNDLPRPAIYEAYHHINVLNKPDGVTTETVNVVGRLCENNDQFAKDRELPILKVGDIIVIHNAGAHAYAMGHNYNGRTRSAEYLAQLDGQIVPIRRAETIADLFRTVVDFDSKYI
jgi:diaminopimelate decarboxylase